MNKVGSLLLVCGSHVFRISAMQLYHGEMLLPSFLYYLDRVLVHVWKPMDLHFRAGMDSSTVHKVV